MAKGTVKCYQCEQEVIKDNAKMEIHETEKNKYRRYFHQENCYDEYLKSQEEKKKWDELYEYVRTEIFKYDKGKSLSKHCVNRLQGLRSGEYGTRRNVKVFLSENGYPYEIILMAFKVKKVEVINALNNNYKLTSEQSKVNYMIAIIQNNINDICIRLEEKKKSDERIEKIEIDVDTEQFQFVNKTEIKQNKVANKLSHLF